MRWVRSALLASIIVCLSGLAHADGGGHPSSPGLLALLCLSGTPVLFLASHRQWRFGPLFAVISLSQVGFHALMSMTMNMRAGHVHALHVTPAAPGSDSAFFRMVIAHATAALLLAGLFTWAEAAWWWVARRFVIPAPAVQVVLARPRLIARAPRLRQLWMAASLRNRGPPRRAAVFAQHPHRTGVLPSYFLAHPRGVAPCHRAG